ncbi:MAG: DNA-directed RNA polymerase specialized sigma24 family protein [Halieaceae bacterium]
MRRQRLELLNRFKTDEALMLSYQSGDTRAFERLYRRHKDGLFAFLYRGCQRQAIAVLPEEQRTALLLQEQGFSNEDIAVRQGTGTGAERKPYG